jgi:hypothetical protein
VTTAIAGGANDIISSFTLTSDDPPVVGTYLPALVAVAAAAGLTLLSRWRRTTGTI